MDMLPCLCSTSLVCFQYFNPCLLELFVVFDFIWGRMVTHHFFFLQSRFVLIRGFAELCSWRVSLCFRFLFPSRQLQFIVICCFCFYMLRLLPLSMFLQRLYYPLGLAYIFYGLTKSYFLSA